MVACEVNVRGSCASENASGARRCSGNLRPPRPSVDHGDNLIRVGVTKTYSFSMDKI